MDLNKTMANNVLDFFFLLFDGHDGFCVSKNVLGTKVYEGDMEFCDDFNDYQFFSINALTKKRKDENVTSFRNILLEFDDISLRDQLALINTIPKSTVVFSGGKSYHVIISLVNPCKNREEYNKLVKRIYDKVPQADKQAKNPSRFSRTPEAIRDNGKKQDLIYVGKRITDAELNQWLGPEPKEEAKEEYIKIPVGKGRILKGTTSYFLEFGAEPGSWNKDLFLAAMDMSRSGIPDSEIYERLYKITGKLDNSDHRTIKSALYNAKKERE